MADSQIFEKIGTLQAKIEALHGRQDRTELLVRDELKKVDDSLEQLLAFMNQSKGWANAGKYAIGALGGSGLVAMLKFLTSGAL